MAASENPEQLPSDSSQQEYPPPQSPYVPAEASSAEVLSAERHRLHHSYIWLQTLRALPVILVVCFASIVPFFMGLLEEYAGVFAFSIVGIGIALSLATTLLLCGLSVGWAALSYRFMWYEFTPGEFSYYTGILNKKHVHIPYHRIQSVNQKTSLLQRLLGVCTVEIDTAGGSSNTAISLTCIKREEAERIRREVFMRKSLLDSGMSAQDAHAQMHYTNDGAAFPPAPQPNVASQANTDVQPPFVQSQNILDAPAEVASDMRGIFGGVEVNTGAASYEIGLTNKELLLSALTGKTSFSLVLAGVIVAIASAISFAMDLRIVSDSTLETATSSVISATSMPFLWMILLVGVLIFIVGVWVVSFVGTCLYYGGFKASRRGNRIEVGQGIITHTLSGMDIDRIQSITITQSLFQRLLGYCTLAYGRVAAASSDQVENSSSTTATTPQETLVVHPFLKLDRVDEVIEGLTPEHRVNISTTHRLPKKALRRALTRRVILQGFGFWLAVVVTLLWAGLHLCDAQIWAELGITTETALQILRTGALSLYLLCVIIAVAEAIGACLWYKLSGFAFEDRYVMLVNGGFSRSIVVVPRNKIQMSCVRRNPLQRLSGVATMVVITAQGTSSKKETLMDVANDDAQSWLAWSLPKTSR